MANRYRIVLADDHALVRRGLRRILGEKSELEIVGEAGDGLQLLGIVSKLAPDLVILDVSMPNIRGIEAIPEIRRAHSAVKILILTMHKDEEYLYEAISAGANGYLLKEDAEQELFAAINDIRSGKIYISPRLADRSMEDWARILRGEGEFAPAAPLTVREREVLKLIVEGKSNKEIGDMLCISVRTVERHRANMMDKIKVRKTADLVQYALRKRFV